MNGLLEAQALSVRLGRRMALEALSLALRPGEVTAVVGPNGAGKSTLMSCLAGLRRPLAGEVRLAGAPLLSLRPRTRARAIGYLPQVPEIAWRLDVETFVRLGRTAHRGVFGETPEDGAAVRAALGAAGLEALAGRDVTTLSGGERSRALLARALAGTPSWLLADEPLAGLDPGHQLDAADLLRAFAGGGGGVVVTLHDLTFAARVADRVVVLAEGRLLADGDPLSALKPAVLAAAYGVEVLWREGAAGPLLDISGRAPGGVHV